MFLQICDGVKAFHDAQPIALAHRDLKPANVLLDVDNTPVIMDLGRFSIYFRCDILILIITVLVSL